MVLTIVDHFNKYCHFIPLAHPYTVESVARTFFTDIVCLHGVPQSLISDRDPIFTLAFWRETEAANRVIVMYLCFFIGDCPCQWLRWLPWA